MHFLTSTTGMIVILNKWCHFLSYFRKNLHALLFVHSMCVCMCLYVCCLFAILKGDKSN